MKKIIAVFSFCFLHAVFAFAQFTTTTATITDSDSTVWTSAQVSVAFQPNPNQPNLGSYNINGVPLTGSTYAHYLQQASITDNSGALSFILLDNQLITPAGSSWKFVIRPNANVQAISYNPIQVTGASQSLSSYLSTNSIAPRLPAVPGAYAYADVEIFPTPQTGGQYFNSTSFVVRIWNGTAWQNGSSTGGTIPATTNLLKGSGSSGVSVPATPGVDYTTPAGTIAQALALAGIPTKCSHGLAPVGVDVAGNALDCQVIGATGAIPATGNVLKGSGTAGSAVAASPGVDFMAAPISPAFGTVPIFTGAGGAYNNLTVPQSYSSFFNQYIEQTVNNTNYTTFGVNNLNNEFYVDGFAGGNFGGIGLTTVAWSSGADLPICQKATFSGNNYIAISPGNGTTTPGTNLAIWWQSPSANSTKQFDCAFAVASSFAAARSINTTVHTGGGFYQTDGVILPGGLYGLNYAGCGIFCSYITYTGTAGQPMVQRPTGGNFASLNWSGATFDANRLASSIMDMGAMNQSEMHTMAWVNLQPGNNHFAEWGLSAGDAFQVDMRDITWSGGNEKANTATIAANIVSGSVTSFTVSNGGSGYPTASANVVYHTQLTGYGSGNNAAQPCTVMPSGGMVPTLSGGVITALSAPTSTGSGCSGTIYVQVYTSFPVTNGVVWNASDSISWNNTGYAGDNCNVLMGAGNNKMFGWHPSVVPGGVCDAIGDTQWFGTEIDAVFNCGFTFTQPFSTTGSTVAGTNGYVVGRVLTGSRMYCFNGTTHHVTIAGSGALCDGGIPTGWTEFATQSGPILTSADYFTKAPAGFAVVANDTACGETMGDWQPIINANTATIGALTVTSCTGCAGAGTPVVTNPGTGVSQTVNQTAGQLITLAPILPALSGTNINSPAWAVQANYWNGTATAADNCQMSDQANAGTNPLMALIFSCGGSSGGHQLLFGPTITNTAYSNLVVFAGGLKPQPYTVSTLPSAASVSSGTTVLITDCTTFTPGALCTGGGSDYMLGVSNGTVWTVH